LHSSSGPSGASLAAAAGNDARANPPILHHLNEQIMRPDRRLIELFKTEFPIVLAPMAGIMDADLVIAASQGGALGSLPCAMLSVEKAREQVNIIRQRVSAPVNMNFFCHGAVEATARPAGRSGLGPILRNWGSTRRRRSTPPTARRSTPRCAT
jgi:nitronate monooxygenase